MVGHCQLVSWLVGVFGQFDQLDQLVCSICLICLVSLVWRPVAAHLLATASLHPYSAHHRSLVVWPTSADY